MEKFVIISDSTCDLDKELRERFNIEYIKSHIYLNEGEDVLVDLDSSNDELNAYYKELKKKNNTYHSAPPSIEEFKEGFKKFLDNGQDVLCFSMTSAMSGTYNFAKKACEEISKEYPDRKIIAIDSKRYSVALGLLMVKAIQLRSEGKTIEEVASEVEKIKYNINSAGPMDDLFFLAKKGRVKGGAAFMGSLIGIKPMGIIGRDGKTKVIYKAKGLKKALITAVEYVKKTIVNPQDQIILIGHSYREKEALKLKELIEQEVHPKEIHMIELFKANATNVGPGLYSAYYFGLETSEDLAKETAIFKEITK